jgi:hypothetical protein
MSSVSGAGAPGQYQIAVAKLQLDAVEQQGKDAIALIESSVAPGARLKALRPTPGRALALTSTTRREPSAAASA